MVEDNEKLIRPPQKNLNDHLFYCIFCLFGWFKHLLKLLLLSQKRTTRAEISHEYFIQHCYQLFNARLLIWCPRANLYSITIMQVFHLNLLTAVMNNWDPIQ